MIIRQSTIETLYDLVGEERLPRTSLMRLGVQVATHVDRDTWMRRADLALVGGDPLVLAIRLRRLLREGRIDRVAVILDPQMSPAPLAVLNDPECLVSLVEAGDIPARWAQKEPGRPGGAMGVLDAAMVDLAAYMDTHPVQGILATGHLQAGRDSRSGKILLRAAQEISDSLSDAEAGLGGTLFDQSKTLSHLFQRRLTDDVLRSFARPPRKRASSRIFLVDACEVLSGFLSPGFGGTGRLGARFMKSEIGADLFHLSGKTPGSVGHALELWRQDLHLAAHGAPASSNTGDLT